MKYFSKLTIGFASYIIISASFMLQFRNFLVNSLGYKTVKLTFLFLFFFVVLGYTLYIYWTKTPIFRIILSIFIFVLGYLLILNQPYFAEKIHVLEYGVLGYLALRDLSKKNNKIFKNILLALFFISIVGTLDEVFQGILPYRVGEIRDVITNIVSSSLGISQYYIYCSKTA